MDLPNELLKNFKFKTDFKSMLRGLNSLLGLNMSRSRLRSLRMTNSDKTPFIIVSQFDLIKFILISDSVDNGSNKALKYDENKNSFEFISSLTGDTKEALLLFEDVDLSRYIKDIVKEDALKDNKFHFYADELSSLLDSYQINNGLVYLYHGLNNSYYILNRTLLPDPLDSARFFYYSKVFLVKNSSINGSTNFVEINRFDLSIKSHSDLSTADLSQMVLPVIHLHNP
jgi:hypothetical protein